ncbi:MAG: helix-turn-helix transcriptional regulator, partial [Thermodesulfobacteriota bacterium]|nr:helix-turn-helix transcriptional regulator [Thermodesulfobacteriota bacterium]
MKNVQKKAVFLGFSERSVLILKNSKMDNWLFLTEQEILEEIGKRLKKIRLQHNLTQKEMSEEVGLSVSTISLIE